MTAGDDRGGIEVIVGPAFGGKTKILIWQVRRALVADQSVQVFKAHLDEGYDGIDRISSHDGSELRAKPVTNAREVDEHVRDDTEVVAIDDAEHLEEELVAVVEELAASSVRVIVAGRDTDVDGNALPHMARLLAVARTVDKLNSVCAHCGEPATRTQRLRNGRPAAASGEPATSSGLETVEARCVSCHEPDGED